MATASIGNCKVFVSNEEMDTVKGYILESDITINEVKEKWSQEFNVSVNDFALKTVDGTITKGSQKLSDIGEIKERTKILNLFVVELNNIVVDIYGRPPEPKNISVPMSATPENIYPVIRDNFDFLRDKEFRLWSAIDLLEPDVNLEDQDISHNSLIYVDIQVQVDVTEAWSGDIEECFVYFKDDCDELFSDDSTELQRITCENKIVDTSKSVMEAFQSFKILQSPRLSVQLQTMQTLVIFANGFIKEKNVWPNEVLGKVIGKYQKRSSIMFDGNRIPTNGVLSDLNLPHCAILNETPISIRVRRSDRKKFQIINIPRMGIVADIEEAARAFEVGKCTTILLRHRGRTLKSEEMIDSVLVDGDTVDTEENRMTITVTLYDRAVRWHSERRALNFTDIMKVMAVKSGVELKHLMRKRLHCTGCGRQLSKETEYSQPIPISCCKIQSLQLNEFGKSNAETQTAIHVDRGSLDKSSEQDIDLSATEKSCFAQQHPPPKRRRTVTEMNVHAGTQTVRISKIAIGTQTIIEKSEFAQQQPPPIPVSNPTFCQILIRDWSRGGRRIPCDIPYENQVFIVDLRNEIAQKLGCKLKRLKLERHIGVRSDDQAIVYVCVPQTMSSDSWTFDDFGDIQGVICRWEDVAERQYQILTDEDTFPMVPGRRNIIEVQRR